MIDNGRDLDDFVAPAMNGFGAGERGFDGGMRGGGVGGGVSSGGVPPRRDVIFQVWRWVLDVGFRGHLASPFCAVAESCLGEGDEQ